MEIKWTTGSVYVCVFVTVLAQSLASSIFSKHHSKFTQNHHKIPHMKLKTSSILEKSCECRIELTDGTVLTNMGKIKHYTSADGTCHSLHHDCRQKCTAYLNLHSNLPTTSTTNGYHFCDLYGKMTSNLGVKLRAVWETTNCHQKKRQTSRKTARLCCGHTSLPLKSDNKQVVAKVFGWNPDCKAQTFIVAS